MNMLVDILLSLLGATLVLSDRAPYEIDENGVKLVKAMKILSECQTDWILMRRRVTRRLIWIQTVCKVASRVLKVNYKQLSSGNTNLPPLYIHRFNGNLDECRTNEVCADVFNFNRTLDNGTIQQESRFVQNCRCPDYECGDPEYDPLVFHETRTQSMITCFPRQMYLQCGPDSVAKEQHNLRNYVFYRINCVCPENENPRGFFNKMTVRTYRPGMGGPRTRLFKCRNVY